MTSTFGDLAEAYRAAGYYPRPVSPGTKTPPMKGWNVPDPELAASVLDDWIVQYAHHGIGLLLGSPLPDQTTLAVVDIDRDEYASVAEVLLGHPRCGRIGQKGVAYFVRLRGQPKSHKFKVITSAGPAAVGDLLFGRAFCVIPPTIHPVTQCSYRWIGTPLLDVTYHDLPLVEA
jgi:hypothetical protein